MSSVRPKDKFAVPHKLNIGRRAVFYMQVN